MEMFGPFSIGCKGLQSLRLLLQAPTSTLNKQGYLVDRSSWLHNEALRDHMHNQWLIPAQRLSVHAFTPDKPDGDAQHTAILPVLSVSQALQAGMLSFDPMPTTHQGDPSKQCT